jgi:hypothetical protein
VLDIQTLQQRGMTSKEIKALPLEALLALDNNGGYEVPKNHAYSHFRPTSAQHAKQQKSGMGDTDFQTVRWLQYQHNIYKRKHPNGGGLLDKADLPMAPIWKKRIQAVNTPEGWKKAKHELVEGLRQQFLKHKSQSD